MSRADLGCSAPLSSCKAHVSLRLAILLAVLRWASEASYLNICEDASGQQCAAGSASGEQGVLGAVPYVLWQTYRTKKLPPVAADAVDVWRWDNPGLDRRLVDDEEAGALVEQELGPQGRALFDSFPIGVMKADFWRYLVLYKHGGVYADVDVISEKPMTSWLPPQDGGAKGLPLEVEYNSLSWKDCRLVVGLENKEDFCQWTLASEPDHPALAAVLQLIQERAKGGFSTDTEHVVHMHTGPGIWTEALTSVLGMPGKSAAEVFRTVYSDAAAFQHAKALGICLLGTNAFRGVNAKNKFASDLWDGRGWVSWTKERDMYLASVRAGKQTS